MTFILFYLLVGLVSYYPCARMDNIKFNEDPQYIIVAVLIWTFAWFPILLAKWGSR